MNRKPCFFIVGAPKCGTTSLAQWLGDHPNIFMPPVKEPHFYSTDLKNRQARTRAEYDRLFQGVTNQHEAVGEASVWYLYSEEAVPNILAEIQDAKFIVCLRNPVDMAVSLHRQHLVACNEDIQSFESAWEAQSLRRERKDVPRLCVDSKLLLYGPACRLGSQVERLYRHCNREQVHCVFLDDMKNDPDAVYRGVLDFLSVRYHHREEFPTANAASQRRSQSLARVVKSANWARRKIGIPRLGTGLMRKLDDLNQTGGSRTEVSCATREKLYDYFRSDIQKLESVTRERLTYWKVFE